MRGCGKVLVWLRELRSQTFGLCSVTGEENNFLFPSLKGWKLERKIFAPTLKGEIFLNCKGGKIVYCYLSFEITTEGELWIWWCLFYRNWFCTARNKLAKWSKQITGSRNTRTRDGFCEAEWDNGYGKLSNRIEENYYIRF